MKKCVLCMEKSSKSLWPIPPDCFIWGLTSPSMDNAKMQVTTIPCWLCGLARFGEKRNPLRELTHGSTDGLAQGIGRAEPCLVSRMGKQCYKNLPLQRGRISHDFWSILLSLSSVPGLRAWEVGRVQPAPRFAKAVTHLMDQAV